MHSLHSRFDWRTQLQVLEKQFIQDNYTLDPLLLKQLIIDVRADFKEWHYSKTAGGLELAEALSDFFDALFAMMYQLHFTQPGAGAKEASNMTLVALGGYGRGALNPYSDLDLLILLPKSSELMPKATRDSIGLFWQCCWDLGIKLGTSTRSLQDCLLEARRDPWNRTALIDARRIKGSKSLFDKFKKIRSKIAIGDKKALLAERYADVRKRESKYSSTIYLQEPNVKESLGGLRDWQNLWWIAPFPKKKHSLKSLSRARLLPPKEVRMLDQAYNFIMLVRNALHFEEGRSTDQLTLRLQGVLAQDLGYVNEDLLRGIEELMREYYLNTRLIYQETSKVYQALMEDRKFGFRTKNLQILRRFSWYKKMVGIPELDGFEVWDGALYRTSGHTITKQPDKLLKAYLYAMQWDVKLSAKLKNALYNRRYLIDDAYRLDKENQETFKQILEGKGSVGGTLRQMHEQQILDKFIPEFGALDCLVQHEFFHRYTADEHTLRCLENLDDLLVLDDAPEPYRSLALKFDDVFSLYFALIFHDAGRAENEADHVEESTVMVEEVCHRMNLSAGRKNLIKFLIEEHLTLWKFGTTKDVEDDAVIDAFLERVPTLEKLDALLVFTYVDSKATNESGWDGYKESSLLRLYRVAQRRLALGDDVMSHAQEKHLQLVEEALLELVDHADKEAIKEHMNLMPNSYFKYRKIDHIANHHQSIFDFLDREQTKSLDYQFTWLDFPEQGCTELVVIGRDRPLFIQKVCCALSSCDINILSASIFTRQDGIVIDLIRVRDTQTKPQIDDKKQQKIEKVFSELNEQETYNAVEYLKKKKSYFNQGKQEQGDSYRLRKPRVKFHLDNTQQAAIEVQTLDRFGLLHDVLAVLSRYKVNVTQASLYAQSGIAINRFEISNPEVLQAKPETISNCERALFSVAEGSPY